MLAKLKLSTLKLRLINWLILQEGLEIWFRENSLNVSFSVYCSPFFSSFKKRSFKLLWLNTFRFLKKNKKKTREVFFKKTFLIIEVKNLNPFRLAYISKTVFLYFFLLSFPPYWEESLKLIFKIKRWTINSFRGYYFGWWRR